MLIVTFPLFIYAIFSLIFFGRTGSLTHWYLGVGRDPLSVIWFLHWWPFAISHGLNPFISNYVWFPHGDNMTWRTSVPFAALLSFPITVLGGAVLSYNLLSLMAPVLSAWTAFLLVRYLTRDWAAALVGGYLFGFSSYESGQLQGHLNLDLTFLIPLAILLCVRRIRRQMGRTGFVIGLAVIFLVQLGLSSEILATLVFLGVITWAIFLACAPKADRLGLWRLAIDIVFAGMVMTILAVPFLFYLVEGLSEVPPIINSATTYSADPLNYLIPTGVAYLGRTVFAAVASQFTGNTAEQGAYLGLPLIFLMMLYFRAHITLPYVKALLITVIVLAVLSLGPWLHVAGVQTQMPLPWRLGEKLPLIRSALPTRFTMYVSLISAIVAGLYLATPSVGRGPSRRFALAGLACLFIVPNARMHTWTRWPEQPFFTPQNTKQALGTKANVIILPFADEGEGMAWQLDEGMQFSQSGGYTGFAPYSEQAFPILSEFLTGVPGPDFGNDLAAFCETHHVDDILIGPGTQPQLVAAIAAQGWLQHMDHGVDVVKVPLPSALNYYYLEGDYWPSSAQQNWMGRQVRIVTHGTPVELTITGKGRPLSVPVQITVTTPSSQVVYTVGQATMQVLYIPADTIVTLTANQTFVPNRIIYNGDKRELSVLLSIKKG
ncbi:glycosyltransferase family protein [Acidocella aromatica]|uniref:DUF6311 domain-containing protein n=1 Tax=Acidocella aromatica TaxID=1303579 RepID=A0A840VEQ6_9PROT|nr:hypothetical protein [Acidocella aromatica]MBB5374318.1 hypothetical protein [Acidocella aromatica]